MTDELKHNIYPSQKLLQNSRIDLILQNNGTNKNRKHYWFEKYFSLKLRIIIIRNETFNTTRNILSVNYVIVSDLVKSIMSATAQTK